MIKEDQNSSKQIVFVGESGFPFGFAAIQRITLMAKSFIHIGSKALVICRKGVGSKKEKLNFPKKGNFEGVDYIYTSKTVYKPSSFIERNVQKLMGIFKEFLYLIKLKRQNKIDLVVVSEMSAFHMFRYLVYSKLLKFSIVTNFVEMASSMQHRTRFLIRVNDYLIDNCLIKWFDGALPISDKLQKYYNEKAPNKPFLKLPIICDFEKFNVARKKDEPYFLYCGSIGYRPVIDFIVDAFKEVSVNKDINLYMIISSGNKNQILLLEQEILKRLGNGKVKLFSNIPYAELVDLYVNARALLIPLRPTVQDASRFPHKIGEYLASGNPVITTDIGEIKNYFHDEKTALIAKEFEINSYAEKLKFVLDNSEEAIKIGHEGKKLGLREFDYRMHGKRMEKFMKEI